ncbi:hypothetical protein OG339_08945 [Streptosporangium sp. NBC_01495]|uniref:hypothetical protein n=1 Tax=Streptosporangium sp. NBC_01495 TaxID=2903899 RepID=UPI002E3570E4|nr:hypothetical protein [Streptosporangium sp. NBC_01495]
MAGRADLGRSTYRLAELRLRSPKGGKLRDIPLPESVAPRLAAHIETVDPPELTPPWRTLDDPPHTARLLFGVPQTLDVPRERRVPEN